MVICLERGADLHMAQLMPLPLTLSCFSKIQIGFTFLVPAHPGSPGKRSVKRVCVCVCLNNILSVLGRGKNEITAVHLVRTYCLPILTYGSEIWHITESEKRSLNVLWKHF